MAGPIYLDYNATTPLDPAVLDAMLPALRDVFGNPSSGHCYGQAARMAIDHAREQVAALLGCAPDEIIFTGGGSESNNHAIKGTAGALREQGTHLLTDVIEHPAVLAPCRFLETQGYTITYLPVDETGMVRPESLEEALTSQSMLVSIMHANNEVGTIQPIAELSAIAHRGGALFHTDAAQSVGKIPVRVDDLGVDLLTIAGHKLYAPKGIGALYVRRGTPILPLIHGAGHENGRRAGTENTAAIVALGMACEVAAQHLETQLARLRPIRDHLAGRLKAAFPALQVNGHPTERLPNTLHVSFPGLDGETILAAAPGIAASTGSACHAGHTEPSAVLLAMGIPHATALGSLRLSLGRWSTLEEVDRAADQLIAAVETVQGGTLSRSLPSQVTHAGS